MIRVVSPEATPEAPEHGLRGSGFYIESVDPTMTVRTYVEEGHGMSVRVDRRDTSACVYDDAYLTLKSEIKGGGPWEDEH